MDQVKTVTSPIARIITRENIFIGGLIFVPLFFNGPQLLVGSLVNMFLILLASTSHRKNWLILSAIPSLITIAHSALFGFFTPYLFYVWPIITLGNWVYMSLSQKNIVVAVISKTLVLTLGATLFFQLKIIPQAILNSMGIIQLITASIGGLGAKIYEHRSKSRHTT